MRGFVLEMDQEEPTAASVISSALNKGHELALRTTELTAVAVLKGEIIVQSSKHVGQRVAFGTVRERVRAQLDSAADDPDLPELFDFLVCAGVGTNSYIEDLLEFGGCFVDSKKRQLRFSAFAVANKICEQAPWSKIAVMKRAYRKKPVNGFCPSPEPIWGDFEWTGGLEFLEDLLRFFHGTCASYVAKLSPQSRQKLLANIDVAATDAFYVAKDPKTETQHQKDSKHCAECHGEVSGAFGDNRDGDSARREFLDRFQRCSRPSCSEAGVDLSS